MSLLCYHLFLLYKLLNMFRATMCSSSGADDCVVLSPRVGIVPWLQEGCQNRLAGSVSIEEFVALVRGATNSSHYLLTGFDRPGVFQFEIAAQNEFDELRKLWHLISLELTKGRTIPSSSLPTGAQHVTALKTYLLLLLCAVWHGVTNVMHVKFTHRFISDKNFKQFVTVISRKRSISHSRRSQQYLSVYYSLLCLNSAVTWSNRYTFRNAWLVTFTLYSLAQPGKLVNKLITGCHVSATEEILWFNIVITEIFVTALQCFTVCCWYKVRYIDCIRNSLYIELSCLAITL